MSSALATPPRLSGPTRSRLDRLAQRAAVTEPAGSIDVVTAATGDVLGRVPRATAADVAEAAAAARRAQPSWAATPVGQRAHVMRRFAELVLDRQDEVLDLIQLENGKARAHAFDEVLDVAQVCRYYAHTAPALLADRNRVGALPVFTRAREYHHPKGVVGIISPWNYPLSLGIADAIPALLAGNAVLAKPDQQTPFSALWAAELLADAGLPAHVLQIITGIGSELGSAIVAESDFLMFTGSTRVGRAMAAQAAERLIDYSMELGGKNPLLILDDADLDLAVPGAVQSCFSNTGQLCISTERIYVDAAVWDRFLPRFVATTQRLRLGHSLDYRYDIGSLNSTRQLDTVARHVDDAVAKGATVLAGGKPRPDLGPTFYEPTILTDTTPDMTVYAEETFGPVVSVYRVEDTQEAIALANESRYGLSASVWTRDARRGREVATSLQSGNVNINEGFAAAWGSLDAPMGGWKDSGTGSRHGAHGLLKYTDSQTVARQRWVSLRRPPGMKPTTYAAVMTAAMRWLARIPGRK